jgi:hypothetical protein
VYHSIRPVKHYKVKYQIGKCKEIAAIDTRNIQERSARNILCNGNAGDCDYIISAGCQTDSVDNSDYHYIEITKALRKFEPPDCGPKCILSAMVAQLNKVLRI